MIRKRTSSFKPRLEVLEERWCPASPSGSIPPGIIYYSTYTSQVGFGSMLADGSNKLPSLSGDPGYQTHADGSGGFQRWFIGSKPVAGAYPNGQPRGEAFATRADGQVQVQLTVDPSVVVDHRPLKWAHDDSFFSFSAVTWTPVASDGNFTDTTSGQQWLADAGVFRATVNWSTGSPVAATPTKVLDAGLYFTTGGNLATFQPDPDLGELAWSPDAIKLAYVHFTNVSAGGQVTSNLRVTTFDIGGNPVSSTQLGTGKTPEWAPNGSRIAFSDYSPTTNKGGLFTVKPDGTQRTQIPKTLNYDRTPHWSPDSTQLAFTRPGPERIEPPYSATYLDVMRIPVTGGTVVNLTKDISGDARATAWRSNVSALLAASTPKHAMDGTISPADTTLLLNEAVARWQSAGVDTSAFASIDIRIADLGGTTLGLASGHTIWLDNNAAGCGWFVDPTPWDDSEFTTPGDQGEQNRIDLLTVLMHEIGHVLGQEHDEGGVMAETLTAGTRLTPFVDAADWLAAVDAIFAESSPHKRRR